LRDGAAGFTSARVSIVKKSVSSPTLGAVSSVEVRGVMTATAEAPRTAHLFPRPNGWIVVLNDKTEDGVLFPDLGSALDAATTGERPVHVIVHDRDAA
jgi:hypothetical protein